MVLAIFCSGVFFTYELVRAAIFGVVLGSAKRHETMHDVFHATDPGTFDMTVVMYAVFDIPMLLVAFGIIISLFKRKNPT